MKLHFSTCLSVLLLFVVLSSCKDQGGLGTQRFRIKKVIPGNSSAYDVHKYDGEYKYDNGGRLIEGAGFTYYYDGKGNLTDAKGIGKSKRYYYSTDTKGRVTGALETDDYGSMGEFTRAQYWLDYSNDRLPVKITKAVGSPAAARQFTYADLSYSGENIVQMKVRIKNETDSYDLSNSIQTLQYDDKPNPFYGLIVVDLDSRLFSENNRLDTNYTYAYDANGLLTKITLKYDGSTVQDFEYEVY